MGVDVVATFHRERVAVDRPFLRGVADVLAANGWTYNVAAVGGYWRDDEDSWTFEETTDDRPDDRKLAAAVGNVVAAGSGALHVARTLPGGQLYGARVSVRPSDAIGGWRVTWATSALPFTGPDDAANQRAAVDLFADLAASLDPYVGCLGLRPGPVGGGVTGFAEPPAYLAGVVALREDVPGVDVAALRASDVAGRVVDLPDGVLFEPPGGTAPWHCEDDAADRIGRALGVEYRSGA